MKRTLSTAVNVWKRRGIFWPLSLAGTITANRLHGTPRGLVVEPSGACTGSCTGCRTASNPGELTPEQLEGFLMKRRVRPVTIHFAGKHSDPLASTFLPELTGVAAEHSSMVSVSTIGLGLERGWEHLPVDRWIVSMPAATDDTWFTLRGNRRFSELKENLERLLSADRAMVELVLTIWKASASDVEPFRMLAGELGVSDIKVVFGRYDPEGYHMGRVENLALNSPDCPYILDGELRLRNEPGGCPLQGTIFLDSSGRVHPCPFTASRDLSPAEMEKQKRTRNYPACRYCP